MKLIIILFLLLSCSINEKNKAQDNPKPIKSIEEKADDYCGMSKELEDEFGFVGHCGDQVLFNSLRAVSCQNVSTDIGLAESRDVPGEWYRDAGQRCSIPAETKTQFSRDMLIGLMYYLWQAGDSKALTKAQNLVSYLKENSWYLCKAPEPLRTSRCKMSLNIRATLYELVYQLGGEDNKLRKLWQFEDPTLKGYQAHLSVLHIMLRGMMQGYVTGLQMEVLRAQKNRAPYNVLFKVAYAKFDDGNMEGAAKQLMEMHEFPDSQLPTSSERCEPYLWQRDSGADWAPCDKGETHPGIDFAFVTALINDKVRYKFAGEFAPADHPYKERK